MKRTVKIDTEIIQEKTDKEKRTYICMPKGVKFFGRFWGLFCKFPGIAYYTKIVYWDKDMNALVIAIPCEQDPDKFKGKHKQDDLYDKLLEDRNSETFAYDGEHFIPVDE